LGWGSRGDAGGRAHGRVVKYYYVLWEVQELQEACLKVVTFKKNIIISPECSCQWQICLDERKFRSKGLKNVKFLPGKIEIFEKFAWKNRNCLEICLDNRNCFTRIHDSPDFKPY